MDCLPMGKYKSIKNSITQNEKNLKYIHERWRQLDKVIGSVLDVEEMPPRELYGHIHALKHHVKSLNSHIMFGNQAAKDIINGWEILNKRVANDPNFAEEWEAFLVTMKLTEHNEAIDG